MMIEMSIFVEQNFANSTNQNLDFACESKNDGQEFKISVANTLEDREGAFRLGYETYLKKGFIFENENKWLINDYDSDPDTVILIAKDNNNNLMATVTLVFDGTSTLPAEEIYPIEVSSLKKSYSGLFELSRFAVSSNCKNSKEVMQSLFNYISIYVHHVMNYAGAVIEVNPRHKNFYKKLFQFEEIGELRKCSQVLNAPGVLMFFPVAKYRAAMKRDQKELLKERLIFKNFVSLEQEKVIAERLKSEVRSLTDLERLYFGMLVIDFN